MRDDKFQFHYAAESILRATPAAAFALLDDPRKLSAHMGKSSWMMAGSRMNMTIDAKDGRVVGSEIVMTGKMMGIQLSLKEVISERDAPKRKAWTTLGDQRLLVIDQYRMGFELEPVANQTRLRVFIDYSIPPRGIQRILGWLFAGMYTRWCTRMMARDAAQAFRFR